MMRKIILFIALLSCHFLPWAVAESYDLKEMTPAVQQAIENRKARFGALQGFKQQGFVGEGNDGFIETLGDMRPAEIGTITEAENGDRRIIYGAIAEQNQLGPQGYEQVKKVFAEVQRGKALPGEILQLADGHWVKK